MWASDRFHCRLLALAFVLAEGAALAQTAATVTDADVDRAKRSQPTITEKDIDAARKRYRMPSDSELARVPIPSSPNVDALPKPAAPAHTDLESIAKGYESILQAGPMPQASGPAFLVFVSFSMPQPTLDRLVDQAAKAKATLVIRGLVNGSLKDTVLRIRRLIGQREVSFQIDPQAFDRFAVTKTPTFVLVRERAQPSDCAAGTCYPPEAFVATAGDVSLDYALEFVQRRAPRFARDASLFLKRLRG